MENNNTLKAIGDLENLKFNIPNYQRGYRWSKNEVGVLLEDIWDYALKYGSNSKGFSNNFYCLQPIIVKKNKAHYNVVDGQQRLTTIFLILKFLIGKNYFEICYQTRGEASKNFLENINKNLKETPNADFYYFKKAYEVIKDFFSNACIDEQKFQKILLESCKVLWYEIQDNEEDVFIRLNIGKIPLLPVENVKALFLAKGENCDLDELKERTQGWYEAEKKARENRDFRYSVLSKVAPKDIMRDSDVPILKDDIQRIEPYLRAICKEENIFEYFYNKYKKNKMNEEWEKLENSINTLSGFASNNQTGKIDREIFNYLGFLVLSDEKIDTLYNLWLETKSKEKFKELLFNKVRVKIANSISKIDTLVYKENNTELFNILLLFNLEYLISQESSSEVFKFNRFQLEQWSLEHICAQNSQSISKAKSEEIQDWLKEAKEYIEDKDILDSIDKFLQSVDFSKGDIKELLDRIDENFKDNESLHKIQNLTLLDRNSNAKIGNQIFSKKRKVIQELGKHKFIPIATKKVFNKEFSSQKDNPDSFTKQDQKYYLEAIKELLKKYKV